MNVSDFVCNIARSRSLNKWPLYHNLNKATIDKQVSIIGLINEVICPKITAFDLMKNLITRANHLTRRAWSINQIIFQYPQTKITL